MTPQLLTLLLIALGPSIGAASAIFLDSNHQPISKVDAVKTLLDQPSATIYRCNEVQLTENLTIKNRKAQK